MTKRHALRDDQWERIKAIFRDQPSDVGVTAKDNRLFVEAVLYRYKTGIPWRDLPERFGDFRVIPTRFSCWSKKGVWEPIFTQLSEQSEDEYAMLDATIVKAHQI
jgi:transposase